MDTRILTLLVFIGITGCIAELHVPFYRVRRNGFEEVDKSTEVDFVEVLRAKRESMSESPSTVESTNTPKSKDATTASAPSTPLANTSTKKSTPTTKSKPSPTSSTPSANAPASKPSPPTGDPSTPKRTTNPTTSKADSTESTTMETEATTTEQPDSDKPTDSKSSSPLVGLNSRIDLSEPSQDSKKKPQKKPVANYSPSAPYIPRYPTNPQFPYMVPDYSSPYGDSTFQSIPSSSNYAWTGTSNGPGMASSFASASAGASSGSYGGTPNYGTKQPSFAERGAFVDNTPNEANIPNAGYSPNAGYIPNMSSYGGFGYGVGGVFPDPGSFAFPGYNPDIFQRQMEDYFRNLQNQFQRQQQTWLDNANRIASDPNAHSAVSSVSLGPNGGYQSGAINPVAPGVQSRFSEDIPPPSGGSYGVFSSSSSKTVVGPDGKPVSHKISTTGVNDNGKITFRTVED